MRDYAQVKANGMVNEAVANAAMDLLEVDPHGFDRMDRRLLLAVIEKFDGGPVGIESLAAAIGEERGTLEDVIEPYLIQEGFLQRTSRGRIATRAAYQHFAIALPAVARAAGRAGPVRLNGHEPRRPDDEVVLPIRVYLEDTDAQGVVYNASYFRFMERARTECLRAQGIDHDQLREEHGVVLVLAGIETRFQAPARLSDMLYVSADVAEARGARVRFAPERSAHRARRRRWFAKEPRK